MHDEEAGLRFWFQDLKELEKGALKQLEVFIFASPVGSKASVMHELAKSLFKGQQVMSIEGPVEIKQEEMLRLQLNEAIGLSYEN